MKAAAAAAILAVLLAAAPAAAAADDGLARHALERVNAARAAEGLEPMVLDETLGAAAQAHADDMLARGYYDHESPEGDGPLERYLEAGGSRPAGFAENIARMEGAVPPPGPEVIDELHDGWMDSPGHRKNILGPYDRFGFGVARGDDRLLAVQKFVDAR